jgi:hypothetical protein
VTFRNGDLTLDEGSFALGLLVELIRVQIAAGSLSVEQARTAIANALGAIPPHGDRATLEHKLRLSLPALWQ